MTTQELYDDLAALPVDDVDGVDLLFGRKADLAKIKHEDEARYEKLRSTWRARRVPRLPQLDRAVDAVIREAKRKQRTGGGKPGKDGFIRDQNGSIVSNADNIRVGIEKLGVMLSYDGFRGWPKVEGLPSRFGPGLDDAALDRLWLQLDEEFQFRSNRALFDTVVSDACMQNWFHPIHDYLDGLVWDGKPRLDRWLVTYAKAEDSRYTRAVGALVLVAAVRRVRTPGSKFDEMLVLESAEQGLNKSSLIAALAPQDEWFTDSVQLNVDDKGMIEQTAGKWICEVGELQGMRKGEVERIRAQLSRSVDRARLAYARLPVEVPRQNVVVGSSNAGRDAPYLADLAGNRRFWPVEVGRCDVDGFVRDRDQVWAEAAAREAQGVSIRLPEELWAEARKEQDARAIGNAYADVLSGYLADREGIILATHLWQLLNIPVERRDSHGAKFGAAMKSLGWQRTKRRRTGRFDGQPWCYYKGNDRVWLSVERNQWDRDWQVVVERELSSED